MNQEQLKKDIESISKNLNIPIHFVEYGINEARRNYNMQNASPSRQESFNQGQPCSFFDIIIGAF